MKRIICVIVMMSLSVHSWAQSYAQIFESISDSVNFHYSINSDKVGYFLTKKAELAEFIKDDSVAIEAYAELGNYVFGKGDNPGTLVFLDKIDSIAEVNNNLFVRADVLSKKGVVYCILGYYQKAIDALLSSNRINEEVGDLRITCNNYANLSNIYDGQNKLDKAIKCCKMAYEISISFKDTIGDVILLGNLSNLHSKNEDYESAKKYLQLAKEKLPGVEDDRVIVGFYMHSGDLNGHFNKSKESEFYYKKAIHHADSTGYEGRLVLSAYEGLIRIAVENGDYENAISLAKKNIVISETGGAFLDQRDAYEQLIEVYIITSESDSAIMLFDEYKRLTELEMNQDKDEVVKNFELKNQILNQNNELSLYRQKKTILDLKVQRQAFVIGASITLIILLLTISFFFFKGRKQKWDMAKNNLQNQLFRSQVDPHFIFNAFNSIQSCLISGEYDLGEKYLRKFAVLIREFLEKSDSTFSTIQEEVKMISLYLEIEAFRLDDSFKFDIVLSDEIESNDYLIPSFITQIYLENAIWHGVSNLDKDGMITVKIEKVKEDIVIVIEDNGDGVNKSLKLKQNSRSNHKSKGMSINESRLKNLSKLKKKVFEVNVQDLNDLDLNQKGTRITLCLPIIESYV